MQEVKAVVKQVKDQLYEPNELLNPNHKRINFDVAKAAKAASDRANGVNGKGPLNVP